MKIYGEKYICLPIRYWISLGKYHLFIKRGFLFSIDAEDLTEKIETYREQIGAWWLGWIILAILLAIPGVPMSWLPRRLPSEVSTNS